MPVYEFYQVKNLSKAPRCDQRNWDDILLLLMLAYRSSKHESIGFTPCRMMFGREAELPVDLLYGLPQKKQEPCTNTNYVVTLSERLDKIHKLAFNQMALVRELQKRQYVTILSCLEERYANINNSKMSSQFLWSHRGALLKFLLTIRWHSMLNYLLWWPYI
jgi:hypothetical protein